jgi:hypothetical protein
MPGDVVEINTQRGNYRGTVNVVEKVPHLRGKLSVHTPGGRMGGGTIEMFDESELTFLKPGGKNWWLRRAGE